MAKFVSFRINGEKLDFSSLTEVFKEHNIHICRKGESFQHRFLRESIIHNEDVFSINKEYSENFSDDTAVNQFMQLLLPKKDFICNIAEKFNTIICLSVYPESYHSCVHLSAKTLKTLSDMGVEFYVETTFLKEIYESKVVSDM